MEDDIVRNLKRCPTFDKCSLNLCPLDFDLKERTGSESDKCRWMKEARQCKIGNQEFIAGGKAMPDELLEFVPESNLGWLNEKSQKRWSELKRLVKVEGFRANHKTAVRTP